ncbi:MAG: hypothetical protein AAF705_12110 [Bacteroidota bacterium]
MKNLTILLFLLFAFLGTTRAQGQFRLPQQVPQLQPHFNNILNCSDFAVKLEIHRIDRIRGNSFRITFKATLKNLGPKNFNNRSNLMITHLRASRNYPARAEDKVSLIQQMRVGETRVTYLTLPWSASWRVGPSVIFSVDNHPSDCNRANNKVEISHQAIIRQFKFQSRANRAFGRF